ncbi:SDR family NAD(P)-dependent oxidoreductase [Altererythrobacter sp. GH1-8]|uniref:SDR family NAD(P)-dependent oxidoreductase n=1 Tax=Altererythrobacter sp. GH1-8 TaxID=3349333 RepID=UPI00374DE9AC
MNDAYKLAPAAGSKIAVIGACGGIGSDIVQKLVVADCEVAAIDLEKSIHEAPSTAAHVIAFDGRDENSIDRMAQQLESVMPRLDGLVIASGFAGQRMPIGDWSVEAIDEIVSGNLRLMTLCLRALVPLLQHEDTASVVLITSDMAYIPQPGYAPYVAAKAGLVAMGQSVAREVAPNVRINFVSPGAVDTPFLRGGRGRTADPHAPLRFDMDEYLEKIPLARLAVAEDVTGPTLFLLGPGSSYMTGNILHISGGAFMG